METPNIGHNITGPIFPTFSNAGVQIYSVVPGSPAYGIIPQGAVIQSINGVNTTSLASAEGVFSQLKIGENISLQTTSGNYTIKTATNPDNSSGYIGIRVMQQQLLIIMSPKLLGPKFHGSFSRLNYYSFGYSY